MTNDENVKKRQTYLQVPGGLLTKSALSAEAFEFRLLRVEGPTARWSLGPRETTTLTQSPGCWGSELPKVATLSLSSRLIPSWVGLPKSRCNILSFNDEHSLAKSDLFTLKVQPLTESWPNKTLLLKEMKTLPVFVRASLYGPDVTTVSFRIHPST